MDSIGRYISPTIVSRVDVVVVVVDVVIVVVIVVSGWYDNQASTKYTCIRTRTKME